MKKQQTNLQRVLPASGCFWGREYHLSRLNGVIKTSVGFAGGTVDHPSYQQVCHKNTGHAEVVEVWYDPAILSFSALLAFFFQLHDAAIDRRDNGGQYRSAIFYTTEEQKLIAQSILSSLHDEGLVIYTELNAAGTFWPAAEKHQQYCETRGILPLNTPRVRFNS